MLSLSVEIIGVERIGKVAVIRCGGRIVRSDAAFRLRDAVTQQMDARLVLLDLSGVRALEGGGLGTLVFLQFWTRDHGIQFKVCDPPAAIRLSLERARSAAAFEIASLHEELSRLGSESKELWDASASCVTQADCPTTSHFVI